MLTLVKQRNEPARDRAQRDETKEKNNFSTALRKLLDSKSYWPAAPGGAMEAAAPDAETKIGRERCCLRCQESILQLRVSQTGPRARQLQTGPSTTRRAAESSLLGLCAPAMAHHHAELLQSLPKSRASGSPQYKCAPVLAGGGKAA